MTGHDPAADAEDSYPLSLGQEGLWLVDRLSPGGSAYHVTVGVHLEGPLDVGVLAGCLGEVVARHEVLRSRFAEGAGGPVAWVAAAGPVECPVVDL